MDAMLMCEVSCLMLRGRFLSGRAGRGEVAMVDVLTTLLRVADGGRGMPPLRQIR